MHCRCVGRWRSSYTFSPLTSHLSPTPSFQIPIIVVPLTALFVVVFYWKSVMRFFGISLSPRTNAQRTSTSTRPRASQSGEQRVLTAEQLVNAPSTTNLVNSGATPSGSAEPRPQRRRRRPRRTPSQISTRSLPPYMAQAGEQELVLARYGIH